MLIQVALMDVGEKGIQRTIIRIIPIKQLLLLLSSADICRVGTTKYSYCPSKNCARIYNVHSENDKCY